MHSCEAMVGGCLRRIRTWRTPPNYSPFDWMEEIHAQGFAAAWQATCEYDPSRGVPFPAFVRQRVIADAFTRYRQEWTYATHCVPEAELEMIGVVTQEAYTAITMRETLRYALTCLSADDRRLIEQLLYHRRTEAEVAAALGITQQAVSKRKRAILRDLRRCLDTPNENGGQAVLKRSTARIQRA